MLLALYLGKLLLIGVPAMRADRTVGPAHSLKGFAGLVLVMKHGVLENGRFGSFGFGHRFSPMSPFYKADLLLSSI
jgi:hypothetical protein